jgi:prephenate dehydrogenase
MKERSDFKKITIIGVGLIGGSLGLALKEKRNKRS